MKTTYLYDPKTKKVVEKSKHLAKHSSAIHVFTPRISAIDGTEIRDAAQLAVHDRKYGVTDPRNYGPDWFTRKSKERDDRLTGQTKEDKQDRLNVIAREAHKYIT